MAIQKRALAIVMALTVVMVAGCYGDKAKRGMRTSQTAQNSQSTDVSDEDLLDPNFNNRDDRQGTVGPDGSGGPVIGANPAGTSAEEGALTTGGVFTGGWNTQCDMPYRADTEKWFPGIPIPPSTNPICTGGVFRYSGDTQTDYANNIVNGVSRDELRSCTSARPLYTDSARDNLMGEAVRGVQQDSGDNIASSISFAREVDNAVVYVNQAAGQVSVRVGILVDRDQDMYKTVEFVAEINSAKVKRSAPIYLGLLTVGGRKFRGNLTCTDESVECSHAIVQIQEVDRKGGSKGVAYIVHRWGEAVLTVPDEDVDAFRMQMPMDPNAPMDPQQMIMSGPPMQGPFADYGRFMANTVNNMCVDKLMAMQMGQLNAPECAQQRLMERCGNMQRMMPAASKIIFRSYAVAYGKSEFEVSMLQQVGGGMNMPINGNMNVYGRGAQYQPVLTFAGDMLRSSSVPGSPVDIRVGGPLGRAISKATLVANDGGGNLNLQVNFVNGFGGQQVSTRLSITSVFPE